MENCTHKISADLLFDCSDKPLKGLAGSRAVLLNVSELDWSSITQTGATVTALGLETGATGYKVEWYKELASTASEFVANTEGMDGFTHSFLCRLATTTAANAEAAADMKDGKFVMVVETNYKGVDNEEAFKVYGLKAGLTLTEMSGNSNENDGSLLYTLSTAEGSYEEYPYQIFLEEDYATSKAAFDSLFASV